jgi:hypothetical protein
MNSHGSTTAAGRCRELIPSRSIFGIAASYLDFPDNDAARAHPSAIRSRKGMATEWIASLRSARNDGAGGSEQSLNFYIPR